MPSIMQGLCCKVINMRPAMRCSLHEHVCAMIVRTASVATVILCSLHMNPSADFAMPTCMVRTHVQTIYAANESALRLL